MKREFKTPSGKWISVDDNGFITVDIVMGLNDLMHGDYECVLDTISEKATGTICLSDFSYEAISVTKEKDIVLRVVGDVLDLLREDDCFEKLFREVKED